MAFGGKLTPETARNMNSGFSLVQQAMALLKRIDESLLTLVRRETDRTENALGEGVSAFGFTVGAGGITNNGWNGTNAVEANPKRRGLYFKNTTAAGGASVTLGLGVRQPSAGAGIVLAPGDSWDGRVSGALWTGSVAPVASAGGATLAMMEA